MPITNFDSALAISHNEITALSSELAQLRTNLNCINSEGDTHTFERANGQIYDLRRLYNDTREIFDRLYRVVVTNKQAFVDSPGEYYNKRLRENPAFRFDTENMALKIISLKAVLNQLHAENFGDLETGNDIDNNPNRRNSFEKVKELMCLADYLISPLVPSEMISKRAPIVRATIAGSSTLIGIVVGSALALDKRSLEVSIFYGALVSIFFALLGHSTDILYVCKRLDKRIKIHGALFGNRQPDLRDSINQFNRRRNQLNALKVIAGIKRSQQNAPRPTERIANHINNDRRPGLILLLKDYLHTLPLATDEENLSENTPLVTS